jgi:hypothetical protein
MYMCTYICRYMYGDNDIFVYVLECFLHFYAYSYIQKYKSISILMVIYTGRFDMRLPNFVVEELQLLKVLEPLLSHLRSIMTGRYKINILVPCQMFNDYILSFYTYFVMLSWLGLWFMYDISKVDFVTHCLVVFSLK